MVERAIAVVLACLQLVLTGPAHADRFIAFSDLHFDPTADPLLVEQLLATDVSGWAELLESVPADYGAFGRDATWPLVRSALDQMRLIEPAPAFLLLTGDLLAHRLRAKFAAARPTADSHRYDLFVVKTADFLAQEIMRRFPDKRVFLALGNNDSVCGDYMLAPDGRFLADTQKLVRRLLRVGESEGFDHGWDAGHGYDVANGTIPHLRMIFVNSIFFSPHYDDACATAAPADPGLDAIAWLAKRLAAAERAGEKVWLLMHIPPGADAFATLRAGVCPTGLRAMWSEAETDRFLDLIGRYARTVTVVYAGHTHMDEFRLLGDAGAIGGIVLGTPAISPIFGQNPGFHVYDTDANGRLVDRETWALGDLSRAARWEREYRFSSLWGLGGLTPTTMADLAAAIGNNGAARADWYSVFRVGRLSAWGRTGGVASLPRPEFEA